MNYYEELGVSAEASVDEIRHAGKILARLLHPDHYPDPELQQAAAVQMQRLQQVLATLTNPTSRHYYNLTLDSRFRRPAYLYQMPAGAGSRWSRPWIWGAAGIVLGVVLTFGTEFALSLTGWPSQQQVAGTVAPASAPQAGNSASLAPGSVAPGGEPSVDPGPVAGIDTGRSPKVGRDAGAHSQPRVYTPAKPPATLTPPAAPADISAPYSAPLISAQGSEILPAPSTYPAPRQTPARTAGSLVPGPSNQSERQNGRVGENTRSAEDGNSLGGVWRYVPSEDVEKGPREPFPPESIVLTIFQRGSILSGRFQSRYRVARSGLIPEVDFRFQGTLDQARTGFDWTSPQGNSGRVRLQGLSARSLELIWNATHVVDARVLVSGRAVLVRDTKASQDQ